MGCIDDTFCENKDIVLNPLVRKGHDINPTGLKGGDTCRGEVSNSAQGG